MGFTADAVTVIGAVGTILAAVATGLTGWLFAGAAVMTILVIFDSLDGSVASITTGGTPYGAFLDSTLDRIADWAVLVSVVLYFILHTHWSRTWTSAPTASDAVAWTGIAAALVAVMTSFVTSYARARAESVGYEAKNGIATRSDRLAVILVGMALAGITRIDAILTADMVILAVLGAVTVVQRMVLVHREMSAKPASGPASR